MDQIYSFGENSQYTISLESMEYALLPINKLMEKYQSKESCIKMRIFDIEHEHKLKTQDEKNVPEYYLEYEIENVKSYNETFEDSLQSMVEDTEIIKTESKYCFICRINIPKERFNRHVSSEIHNLNLRIVQDSVNRLNESMIHELTITNHDLTTEHGLTKDHDFISKHALDESNMNNLLFCDICCESYLLPLHFHSQKHSMNSKKLELLKNFTIFYLENYFDSEKHKKGLTCDTNLNAQKQKSVQPKQNMQPQSMQPIKNCHVQPENLNAQPVQNCNMKPVKNVQPLQKIQFLNMVQLENNVQRTKNVPTQNNLQLQKAEQPPKVKPQTNGPAQKNVKLQNNVPQQHNLYPQNTAQTQKNKQPQKNAQTQKTVKLQNNVTQQNTIQPVQNVKPKKNKKSKKNAQIQKKMQQQNNVQSLKIIPQQNTLQPDKVANPMTNVQSQNGVQQQKKLQLQHNVPQQHDICQQNNSQTQKNNAQQNTLQLDKDVKPLINFPKNFSDLAMQFNAKKSCLNLNSPYALDAPYFTRDNSYEMLYKRTQDNNSVQNTSQHSEQNAHLKSHQILGSENISSTLKLHCKNPIPSQLNNIYVCKICNVKVPNNDINILDHNRGKAHGKKLKEKQNITELGNTTTDVGNKTADARNKTAGNKITVLGNKSTDEGNNTTDVGNKTTAVGNKTTDVGNKTVTNPLNNWYICKTCDSAVPDNDFNIIEHNRGIFHRIKMKEKENKTDVGNITTDVGNKTTDVGNKPTDVGNKTAAIENKTADVGNKTAAVENKITVLGIESTDVGNKIADLGNKTVDLGNRTASPINNWYICKTCNIAVPNKDFNIIEHKCDIFHRIKLKEKENKTDVGIKTTNLGNMTAGVRNNITVLGNESIAVGNKTAGSGIKSIYERNTTKESTDVGNNIMGSPSGIEPEIGTEIHNTNISDRPNIPYEPNHVIGGHNFTAEQKFFILCFYVCLYYAYKYNLLFNFIFIYLFIYCTIMVLN